MVKSPKNCEHKIAAIIAKKNKWVQKAKKRVLEKKGSLRTIDKNTKIYFLGESYPLKLQKGEKNTLHFIIQEGFVYTYANTFDEKIFLKMVDDFYLQKTKELLPKKVEEQSEKMDLHPLKISFRKTRSQWGSCSKTNALSISTMTMKLPRHLIEYIITHELAHIKHKNHQDAFWKLVARYFPQFKEARRELKEYA